MNIQRRGRWLYGAATYLPVDIVSLDYDFWTGPAAMLPYAPNHVHSNWRWFLER